MNNLSFSKSLKPLFEGSEVTEADQKKSKVFDSCQTVTADEQNVPDPMETPVDRSDTSFSLGRPPAIRLHYGKMRRTRERFCKHT